MKSVELSTVPGNLWDSTAITGGLIALLSWYAKVSGYGMWIDEETIRTAVLTSSELTGIVMGIVGRFKATRTLRMPWGK